MSKENLIFKHNEYTTMYLFVYMINDEWIDYVTSSNPDRLIGRAKGIMKQEPFEETEWTVSEPHPHNEDAIFHAIDQTAIDDGDPVTELVILKIKHF